jgi:hypothetical protein
MRTFDEARLYNKALQAIELLEIQRMGQLQYLPEKLTENVEFSSFHKEHTKHDEATSI